MKLDNARLVLATDQGIELYDRLKKEQIDFIPKDEKGGQIPIFLQPFKGIDSYYVIFRDEVNFYLIDLRRSSIKVLFSVKYEFFGNLVKQNAIIQNLNGDISLIAVEISEGFFPSSRIIKMQLNHW